VKGHNLCGPNPDKKKNMKEVALRKPKRSLQRSKERNAKKAMFQHPSKQGSRVKHMLFGSQGKESSGKESGEKKRKKTKTFREKGTNVRSSRNRRG